MASEQAPKPNHNPEQILNCYTENSKLLEPGRPV